MTLPSSGGTLNDFRFSDAEFRAIAELAQRQFGLNLAESKKPLVYSRLSKRLKARGVPGFPEYLALLDRGEEQDERLQLISALTTNVTSFFRENHHFEYFRKTCMPDLIAKAQARRRVRIWSAGCSSGQEPFSIAMTVLDCLAQAGSHDIRILATDIDPKIVQKAQHGIYSDAEAKSIPPAFRSKWVTPAPDRPGHWTMAEPLKKLITFRELNLVSAWPFGGPFDAIFCRNVAIYFNQPTQQALWQRFSDMLVPGGHLFIGHSERVTGPAADTLAGIGITSYRKSSASSDAPGK